VVTERFEETALSTYSLGREQWLALALPTMDASALQGTLASGDAEDVARLWTRRHFRRALDRASAEDRARVESALADLRAELEATNHQVADLRAKHTLALVAIVADFLAHALGFHNMELHVLCALVFLLVEFADWIAPVAPTATSTDRHMVETAPPSQTDETLPSA
jgi:hypothetical protein